MVLDAASHEELPYHWGVNLVSGVIAGGTVVVHDREVVHPLLAPVTPTTSADGGSR